LARLERSLKAADLKLKTDVKTLREKAATKRSAVEEMLSSMRQKEKIALR